MLRSLRLYTVYLSPEAPSNCLRQTDMRGIWRLSCSQTAMTSYPTLAPHLGRERIKASVAFTGGETSKDDFAWWDNLVTTGVYVVLKCVCDTAALKIGSERECSLFSSLSASLSSRHLHVLSGTAALFTSLFSREGAEVCLEQFRMTGYLNISFEPGCSFMQISSVESIFSFLLSSCLFSTHTWTVTAVQTH